jgi:3-hydroxyacyl-[acyl-carrier-protein] dehydratase
VSRPAASDRFEKLLEALPHREPFRFVDAVAAIDPLVRGSGEWNVRGDEDFFRGHFPGMPIVPGVLITEALAQLCGLVANTDTDPIRDQVRLAQIDVKVQAAVRPPARISLSASFVRALGDLMLFDVEATAAGVTAATGRLVLARVRSGLDDERGA